MVWIRIRILLFFVIDLQDANKKTSVLFLFFLLLTYFLKVHLHHYSKIKSQEESQNSRNQGFSYYFCMMIEGSGSIPLTSGSGSGWGGNILEDASHRIGLLQSNLSTTQTQNTGFWTNKGTRFKQCCGYWLSWIRIWIHTGKAYPDPKAWELTKINK